MASLRDLARTRVRPSFSSTQGPSSTSTTSSTSAVRRILALLIWKSSVMAMDLATTKYCWRKAQNLRWPTPPASMCRQSSSACSGFRVRSSRECRSLHSACSEARSSPGCSSSAKSSSALTPRFRASARNAAEAWPARASTRARQAPRTDSRLLSQRFAADPDRTSRRCNSRLTSNIGPFTALVTLPSCSFRYARASATLCVSSAARRETSSCTEAGVVKASSSAPLSEASGAAASSSFFPSSSMALTLAAISPVMMTAAFFSRISMCASLSACSRLAYSFLAAAAFFFSCSRLVTAAVTFSRSFTSSARASERAPCLPADASSALFVLKYSAALWVLFMASSSFLSISWEKVLKGDTSSRYTVPAFPSIVTKPDLPLERTRHSTRDMPVAPSTLGIPSASRSSLGSILATVLLSAISKDSVTVMPRTQAY
mmetsp:Transcript_36570/g.116370  ORF Transcript_36570/g.116370 Transcript_36570/m.116370 type:complete len:431 (-) Transcript_36570:38-1330(-)